MENVKKLPELLKAKKGYELNMMIGLDGFVDEIVHMVDKRHDFDTFTRIKTISDLGSRISKAAGLSTNIELVSTQSKLGGNGPILANALIEYGVKLTYVGSLGKPDIHPVFRPMAEKAVAVHSICEAGHTDALEFEDGKIMMGKITSLNELTWENCKKELGGAEGIAKMLKNINLLGLENWTMVPHMADIWEGIINEVFPLLPTSAEKPLAFFDLADPEKRTKEDMMRAMKLIGKFEEKYRTILGLNEKEVYQIADAMGVGVSESDPDRLKNATMATYKALGIYGVVVHPVKCACLAIENEYYYVDGPYCQKPKLTTGAGDNFNAGFCLAQSLGLDAVSSLTLGVCTSGFYVRNAKSPTFEDVINFAEKWGSGQLVD